MDDKCMELYTKLSRLQWLLQRQHTQFHAAHGPLADPTRGQGRVLAMLKLQPEISTKDLSYLLGIRQQSLNELLNKLEKSGYILRQPSESDRRVMMVKLTEKGKEAQQPKADLSGAFDCLSEEEQAAFSAYLDRVIAALEAQLSPEDQEAIDQWVQSARSKMGHELFERLMATRGGFHPRRSRGRDESPFPGGWQPGDRFPGGQFPGDRFNGFGKNAQDGHDGHDPFEPVNHDDFGGPDSHGPAPEGMPSAERFDPGYDGPMPEGRGPCPFYDGKPEPPAPPQKPHDTEDVKQ